MVSARSRHADGPWEFSPHNPVVHTASRDDRWMSVGHGRLVDTPGGRWDMTVHSYANGYRTWAANWFCSPVEWTADGWFRVPEGAAADSAISVPVPGPIQQAFDDPSDDFAGAEFGLQWGFRREYDVSRFTVGNGTLTLAACAKSLADASVLTTAVGGHSYTVEIDIEGEAGCESGLLLFYNADHATGILLDAEGVNVRLANGYIPSRQHKGATRATSRVVNDRQEVERGIVNNHVGNPKTLARRKPGPLAPEVIRILQQWRLQTPYAADSDWVFASSYKAGSFLHGPTQY